MKKNLFILTLCCAFSFSVQADQTNSSEFMKGYIYSKLEDKFCDANIEVDIESNHIIVYNWPDNLECQEIEAYLLTVCPGSSIQFNNRHHECDRSVFNPSCESNLVADFEEGGFLPELNPFFPTMLAQPHILGYSVGYRSYDRIFKSTLPISIGDQFSLYQFKINSCARLYFGIEACVWAIFEAKTKSLSLINADYFIALPLTYINGKFSTRLRVFHQSSHLGDEFLLETPKIVRKNPSMEGIDLAFSYEPVDRLVCFMGYTYIVRSDDSYKVQPNSIYYGFNLFLDFAKIQTFHVEGTPYIATYVENNENNNWNFDSSVALGYQWNKSYGRKLRIFVKGHDGYSAEGQFSRKRSNYVSINLLYGY